jgi:hypothetical protein
MMYCDDWGARNRYEYCTKVVHHSSFGFSPANGAGSQIIWIGNFTGRFDIECGVQVVQVDLVDEDFTTC